MSLAQWNNLSERVKGQKTHTWHIKRGVKDWCIKNQVALKDFRKAVDQGRYRFDCLIIQCIAFDQELYEKLAEDKPEILGESVEEGLLP
jgi:hypothetical protein